MPGWLRLPLLPNVPRDAVLTEDLLRLGAAPAYPAALATLEPFRRRVTNPADDMPGAALLAERLITLPTHSRLEPGDLARLEAWVASRMQEVAPAAGDPMPQGRAASP